MVCTETGCPDGIINLHQGTRLLQIIDLAPIVLGIFSFLLGVNVDKRVESEREVTLALKEKADVQRHLAERLQTQNDELLELNATLDGMVYTASHDLKTPVINFESMLKMLRMVKDQPGNEKMVEEIIQRMEAATVRFKSTIGDLLEVSRVEKEAGELIALNLEPIISEILVSLESYIQDGEAKVVLDLENAEVLGIQSVLTSVFQNLITNSIKYRSAERPPLIQITSQKKADFVEIRFSDNGSGIDLERQGKKMFKMFTRFHSSGEGTGIGLYIVKRSILKLGGNISVESKVGEGTTFIIQLQSVAKK